ncbi:transporter [Natrinema salaciae]|uniref:Uncharacterized protein n=1 Tax=Natrinema salaciae TaxID=1186196 RepID=A0A1H9R628_9EURY|nr:transporter [Natrinema salaciae]SER68176.1 hypothetical protein SAMN04489841_4291 [Natrinema salaciae]
MGRLSTIVILVGIAMLVVPVPPIASALGGVAVVLVGIALRLLTDR